MPSKTKMMSYRLKSRTIAFWVVLATVFVAWLLAIAAVADNKLTQYTYTVIDTYTYYCGWQQTQVADGTESYNTACSDSNGLGNLHTEACDTQKAGKAWLGLCIVGIIVGAVALGSLVFDMFRDTRYINIGACALFGILMLAAVIAWQSQQKCSTILCDTSACSAKWGASCVLALIAGLLGLFASIGHAFTDSSA